MSMLCQKYIGNCNVIYIDNLGNYEGNALGALIDLTTTKTAANPFGNSDERMNVVKKFNKPSNGIFLFARGSYNKDYEKRYRYAHDFKDLIEKNKLGTVLEVEAPNPCHSMNKGTLFVWTINQEALAKWWQRNVGDAQG